MNFLWVQHEFSEYFAKWFKKYCFYSRRKDEDNFADRAQSVLKLLYSSLFISNSSNFTILQSLITLLSLICVYCWMNYCHESRCCKYVIIYIWIAFEIRHEHNAFCSKYHSLHKTIQLWLIHFQFMMEQNNSRRQNTLQVNIETFHNILASTISNCRISIFIKRSI